MNNPAFSTCLKKISASGVVPPDGRGREGRPKYDPRRRDRVRRRMAAMLVAAFPAETQADTARAASAATGYSARQVINWLNGCHDMPAFMAEWLAERVEAVEALAQRIEARR